MSRSHHKLSVNSFCNAGSMKLWKRNVNKGIRRKSKQLLSKVDWDNLIIPIQNEIETTWSSPKDGSYGINKKPDNDECLRKWNLHKGYRWAVKTKRLDEYHLDRWSEYIKLDELVNNHFKTSKRRVWGGCQCLCNKNSWYWRGFRK